MSYGPRGTRKYMEIKETMKLKWFIVASGGLYKHKAGVFERNKILFHTGAKSSSYFKQLRVCNLFNSSVDSPQICKANWAFKLNAHFPLVLRITNWHVVVDLNLIARFWLRNFIHFCPTGSISANLGLQERREPLFSSLALTSHSHTIIF
jgi:hypothetical protein